MLEDTTDAIIQAKQVTGEQLLVLMHALEKEPSTIFRLLNKLRFSKWKNLLESLCTSTLLAYPLLLYLLEHEEDIEDSEKRDVLHSEFKKQAVTNLQKWQQMQAQAQQQLSEYQDILSQQASIQHAMAETRLQRDQLEPQIQEVRNLQERIAIMQTQIQTAGSLASHKDECNVRTEQLYTLVVHLWEALKKQLRDQQDSRQKQLLAELEPVKHKLETLRDLSKRLGNLSDDALKQEVDAIKALLDEQHPNGLEQRIRHIYSSVKTVDKFSELLGS